LKGKADSPTGDLAIPCILPDAGLRNIETGDISGRKA